MSKSGWYRQFPVPLPVPDGEPLVTLRDAGDYVTRLPKNEHDSAAWQTAMHGLNQAAEHDGPIEFARLRIMQALYPKGTPVYRYIDKAPVGKLVRER
jgi:hypothetical protein